MFKKLWYNDDYKIMLLVDEYDNNQYKGCWCYESVSDRVNDKITANLEKGYKIFFNQDKFLFYLNKCKQESQ